MNSMISYQKLLHIQNFIRETGRLPSIKSGNSLEIEMAKYITSLRTKYSRKELSVGEVGALVACDISVLSDTMRRLNRVKVFTKNEDNAEYFKDAKLRRVYSKEEIDKMLKKEKITLENLVIAIWADSKTRIDTEGNRHFENMDHEITYGEAMTFDLTNLKADNYNILSDITRGIEKIHEIDVYTSIILLNLIQAGILKNTDGKQIKTYEDLFTSYKTERLSYVVHRMWYLMNNKLLDRLKLKQQVIACGLPNTQVEITPYTLSKHSLIEYQNKNKFTDKEKEAISNLFNQQYALAVEAQILTGNITRKLTDEHNKVLVEAFRLIGNNNDFKQKSLLEEIKAEISKINKNKAPMLYFHKAIVGNHDSEYTFSRVDELLCKELNSVQLEGFIRNKEAITKLRKMGINSPLEVHKKLLISAYSLFDSDNIITKESKRLEREYNIRIDLAKSIILGYHRLLKGYNENYNIDTLLAKLYCTKKGGNTSNI